MVGLFAVATVTGLPRILRRISKEEGNRNERNRNNYVTRPNSVKVIDTCMLETCGYIIKKDGMLMVEMIVGATVRRLPQILRSVSEAEGN